MDTTLNTTLNTTLDTTFGGNVTFDEDYFRAQARERALLEQPEVEADVTATGRMDKSINTVLSQFNADDNSTLPSNNVTLNATLASEAAAMTAAMAIAAACKGSWQQRPVLGGRAASQG